jgi:O-antigen ligase
MLTEPHPAAALPTLPQIPDSRPKRYGPAWLLGGMFIGLFLWWVLGIQSGIPEIFAAFMAIGLLYRRDIQMPKAFAFWLLFIFWMLLTVTQVSGFDKWVSFVYRGGLYLAATVIFLYVYNASKRSLPTRTIVLILATFWVMVVVGGIVGSLVPSFGFTTPFERILPAAAKSNSFVHTLVHASTTSPRAFGQTGIHRPKAPFIYTNQWGSAYALTLPFAIASVTYLRRRWTRVAMVGTLVLSVWPLVWSFDRGSWLSAGVSMTYALIRLALGRNRRAARFAIGAIFVAILVGAVMLLSPLYSLVNYRLSNGYGDKHRQLLYGGAVEAISQSPIFGFGTPVPSTQLNSSLEDSGSADVGTHGQFWTIVVSHGIPAIVLFAAWFLWLFLKTFRVVPATGGRDPNARFWAHICLAAGGLQMGYYELLPWGLMIMMVAGALALREMVPDPNAPQSGLRWVPAAISAGSAAG